MTIQTEKKDTVKTGIATGGEGVKFDTQYKAFCQLLRQEISMNATDVTIRKNVRQEAIKLQGRACWAWGGSLYYKGHFVQAISKCTHVASQNFHSALNL